MYENLTYEVILKRMLSNVPNNVDKREGSIIFDALSPCAIELANVYIELDEVLKTGFIGTSYGTYLDLLGVQYGIKRNSATKTIWISEFRNSEGVLMDIPIESRFSEGDTNYTIIEKISEGIFKAECETYGEVGNLSRLELIPIEYIENLATASLIEVLKYGENEESDENFKLRMSNHVLSKPFSGNRADYTRLLTEYGKVGGGKFERTTNEEENVKVYFLNEQFNIPSEQEVEELQNFLNPLDLNGEGVGKVGMDHKTLVCPANSEKLEIHIKLLINESYTIDEIEQNIVKVVENFIYNLRKEFQDTNTPIVVKRTVLANTVLNIEGVDDVDEILINSTLSNYNCKEYGVPILTEVELEGMWHTS